MSENAFYKLAPFIQEYIYRHKWEKLREVQAGAIDAIIDGPNHVLICSATASGKTEAALLPIITELHRDPPASIGALYIGPLKALINDQFFRIAGLLEDSDIPVQSWHGDVSQSKKQRFLKRARGILQITPESLEAMLMNRTFELRRLFGDLRYVIIDEVHAFIDSDRGRQVMCQLERLDRFQSAPARRIGLSATLGEPETAMAWMRGASELDVRKILVSGGGSIELALEYFLFPDPDVQVEEQAVPKRKGDEVPYSESETVSKRKRGDELLGKPKSAPKSMRLGELLAESKSKPAIERDSDLRAEVDSLIVESGVYFRNLHMMTQRALKTLIFANSREATELLGLNLRLISQREKLPSFYHVHHGNISAPLRETAEAAMKEDNQPACVAATVTLELGIDLGQLDQVLQINATHSVSSFVQRLGRSGRRGGPARMFFYCTEEQSEADNFGKEIPWNLLQTLATIQLYLDENWIEPPQILRLPLSLLYHQTMSIVYAHTDISPPRLAGRVLTLSPFENVSQEQFRQLLRHLLEIEHLQQTETGRLIIGIGAENIVNNYRFFAVFEDSVEYRVRDKSREIGTVQAAPDVEGTLVLAGYIWRVLSVDDERRIIEVERAKGLQIPKWRGSGIQIHTRILQKMREILLSDRNFAYMRERARKRLAIAQQAAKSIDLASSSIVPLADKRFLVFPWCGTRPFTTLVRLLVHSDVKVLNAFEPYYIEVRAEWATVMELRQHLAELCQSPPSAKELSKPVDDNELLRNKYDRFVPISLLRKAYSVDYLDIPGAVESIRRL